MSDSILDVLKAKRLGELSADEMSSAMTLAQQIIRADYYADVRGLGASILDAIKCGEVSDSDSLNDRLHEEVDGTQRVIYTWQAKCGLLASDNEDAYDEELGEEGGTPEQRMYYAMLRDVREWLASEGIDDDWNGPEDDDDDDTLAVPNTGAED